MGSSFRNRRLVLILAVAVLVLMGGVAAAFYFGLARGATDRVILISVDTLRPDYLGCYNPSIQTTPGIDSLAEQGVLFEDALCNFPATTSSHASMLSGLYSWSHGVRRNCVEIPEDVALLPEILQSRGWTTGGFISLETILGIYGFSRGFDTFDDAMTVKVLKAIHPERRCMDTLKPALAWLDEHRHDKKLFMFLHFADPHGPYAPPEKYTKDLPPPSSDKLLGIGVVRDKNVIPKPLVIDGHREADFYINRYHAEIRYIDDCIGLFLEKLKEWELFDKSMIIFTSDHGEAMGEHEKWFQHYSSLYYVQTRVPLIIVSPGLKPGRAQGIVETVDMTPTILEYLGIEAPPEMEGESFLSRIYDPSLPGKSTWYVDLGQYGYGIQYQNMKYIYHSRDRERLLFDVVRDPEEKTNIISRYPEMRAGLERHLAGFIRSCKGRKATRPSLSPKELQRVEKGLRALGYVE